MAAANRGRGTWSTEVYEPVTTPQGSGCKILLSFLPDDDVSPGKNIALVQVVTSSTMLGKNWDAINTKKLQQNQINKEKDAANYAKASRSTGTSHVDRLHTCNNPVYGAPDLGMLQSIRSTQRGDPNVGPAESSPATYGLGRSRTETVEENMPAKLYDEPLFGNPLDGDNMYFETGALCLKRRRKNRWLGSVTWGWERSGGVISVVPLQSRDSPSRAFVEALEQWNSSRSSKGKRSVKVPIP
jgi:hypothetical protein